MLGVIVTVTAEKLERLIYEALSLVSEPRVVEHIRTLLIEPTMRMRRWDYGEPDTYYECWDVLEESGGLGIAYSERGFGPACPWGLVRVTGTDGELSIGMDCAWYPSFMEAYFESAASEVPIWRVFKQHQGQDYPGTPIGPESDWDTTWKVVNRLRQLNDGARYNHHHSIWYSQDDA